MTRIDRPLDNPINWSFRVGRFFAIDIRVHIVFVLCAIVLLWMELPKPFTGGLRAVGRAAIDAFGVYAILFAVVLLHEFGHCFGARHVGGDADEILLWPLGGLAFANIPYRASAHMITTVAGPMVNVFFCAISSGVLVLWLGGLGAVPWNPLHPFWPVSIQVNPSEAQMWLLRFFGINYVLLLFNLLPIFPFDGGRVLQAWLWPRRGYRRSMELATGIGMVGSIVLGLFGLFTGQNWLLMMIAVFGYLNCWQARRMLAEEAFHGKDSLGYDFSRGFGAFEEKPREPGFFERRRLRKQKAREARKRQAEADHQRAVEQILRKVANRGMDSLNRKEQRILEHETQRQRSKSPK